MNIKDQRGATKYLSRTLSEQTRVELGFVLRQIRLALGAEEEVVETGRMAYAIFEIYTYENASRLNSFCNGSLNHKRKESIKSWVSRRLSS